MVLVLRWCILALNRTFYKCGAEACLCVFLVLWERWNFYTSEDEQDLHLHPAVSLWPVSVAWFREERGLDLCYLTQTYLHTSTVLCFWETEEQFNVLGTDPHVILWLLAEELDDSSAQETAVLSVDVRHGPGMKRWGLKPTWLCCEEDGSQMTDWQKCWAAQGYLANPSIEGDPCRQNKLVTSGNI